MSRRWTSRDVAALAGVSVATVSYVMNGRMSDRIPATTRDRVLAAARQLDYSPNRAAQSLRRRKTEQICLIVDSIGVPTNDQLARDLHATADEAGYGVITMVVDSAERAAKTATLLQQRIADAAVIGPAKVPWFSEEMLIELARGGLPLVAMNNSVRPNGFDVVRAPEAGACGEALDHLYANGRRRIAFVGHREEVNDPTARERSERFGAYRAARERHDAAFDDSLVVEGADDRVAAYQAVTELLNRPDRPDAIFAASARSAISSVWAARDAGLGIPDDVAIVGCGNLPETRITRPPLSTVGPPSADDFTDVSRLLFDRVLASDPPPGRELTTPWVFAPRGTS
ncbi:LacI family transcriptional regulator [Actinobacteria bacterium YIM 96077]|uniref:LacI family transcriptional regulator n=1 Tax=Phytoactinopolyspora halophila TaxID=1981511 RepID=A0A329QQ57_9ACTN|nr:LacI family DNA-binding transcriptional regulator [Phytoactinopolyspora halophila]AYY14582.1 LacI family transcriptional regulator [Actinobacteria bacterium YIM 96077]RAW14041.1 LacI family transcriptional regulator [Phytoactinopolyspora halophila]